MAWERIWGPTAWVTVDGESGQVYAKPAASADLGEGVYRWDGTASGWTALGGNVLSCVTAGWAPHNFLYGLDANGVVRRLEPPSGQWVSVGAPNGRAERVYGGPDQLLAIAAEGSGDVYRWDASKSLWTKIGGPGKKFIVGKSSDAEFKLQIFGQSPDSAPSAARGIYQWRGAWYKEGGPAGDIFVSQTRLFATNPTTGDLMMKSPTGWKRIGGPGRQFATDHRGHVYGLSADGQGVYRWTGTPNQWQQVGKAATAIFAGWDSLLFALSPTTSDLWVYRPDCPQVTSLPKFEGVIRTQKMANTLGPRKVLVGLWDPHRPGHPRPTREEVESIIFGPKPSLRDWVQENSGGRATLVNAGVFGWYDAPASKQGDHYWDNPDPKSPEAARRSSTYHADKYHDGWLSGHVEKWADAVRRAAQDTNLATYDNDHNGKLTARELGVFLCYPQNTAAGYWREAAGQQHPVPKPLEVDGVSIPVITEWYLGNPPHFGIGAHELAHLVLGTPDMYFKGHWPFAAGPFSVSDQPGPWHLSAPEKLKLGWLDYAVVTTSGVYTLPDIETTSKALIVINPRRGGDEYLVLENRWRGTSYDAGGPKIGGGLPADGLAIWKVIEDPALFNAVTPWPPTGEPNEWGRLGVRMIRANGGHSFDNNQALFSKPGMAISDVTAPANLHWLQDRPSGISIKLNTGAGPTMQLQIEIACP